jgi:hypothetical protein
MLLVGVAVFLIRLNHPGPYAMPHQGNLLAALLSLAIGIVLVLPWLGDNLATNLVRWLALAVSPIILFFALYAIFAELEETVSLRVNSANGESIDLRLWVVDIDGAPWVTMDRPKAERHGLQSAKVELLRNGEFSCVHTTLVDDPNLVNNAHELRTKKYAVQRFAIVLGMFQETAGSGTVALKLDPCD